MLRKSSSAQGAPPQADDTDGGKRSWAAMRARLRQGREPIFGAPAVEPTPVKPSPGTSAPLGHKAPASERSAKPAAPTPAPAPARPGSEQDSVVAVHEAAVAPEQRPDAAAPASASNRQATSEAPPPANGADHKGANGADQGSQAPAPPFKPDAGVSAGFEARPDATPGVRIGRVISVAGPLVWGVIEAKAASTVEIGAVVRLQGTSARTFGVITTLKNDGRRGGDDDRRMIEIRLLGEILNAGPHRWRFQRGVSSHPALDSAIHAASREELCAIYARPEAPTVRLGTLKHASDLPAFAITDNLLGKHFAVLGTTGAGKSCAVTVILRAILDAYPYGHVIMLDPHNEYKCGFGARAELIDPSNLKLPYWLLNFEEIAAVLVNQDSPAQAYAEGAILRNAILQARRAYFGPEGDTEYITVDTPVPYRLSDLVRIINEAMGAFNKPESSAPYQHLINRIEAVSTDKRYEFMFSRLTVQDNMGQVMSRILRIPVAGKPITIIDISGVPSEIVDVVVSVLCRLVFEFALWSDRSKAPPILLVCEEAHRYVPRDDQAAFAPTKRAISRIAKEGRKYGLSLCLVTQRPAELSVSSLSQCNTIFALRLSNDSDLEFARNAVPDSSRWLIEALPALNTQEALVLGDGVSVPMHIRFNDLAPEHRPASTKPPFSQAWQSDCQATDLIPDTIKRWRYQIRAASDA
ncbi:MAG TPA: ATP-binding protein [Geminicoccaceae bacterium]